jgi:colanic acid/amylovoran biosynthesis glycosyltransferase
VTRRRACVFSTNFLEYSQTFVYDELRHHDRWDASVICHSRKNEDRFPFDDVLVLDRPGVLGKLDGLLYKVTGNSPTAVQWIRERRFDLLHAHFGPASTYALGPAALLDLPLVVTYHGYDVPFLMTNERMKPRYWRYWAMSRWMLRRVDRFLPASDELARMLIELGAPPDRVHVWRLGVTIPKQWTPRPLHDAPRILMIGRFVEKKGFDIGIRAFAKIAARSPGAVLQIIGDGPGRANLDAIVREHGLGDRVQFLGVMPHAEVFATLDRADVLMAPSHVDKAGNRESGLLVIKEAAARGLPAVGTLHGGIPEIIDDGVTGFLVPERDVDTTADRLGRLVADAELRRMMGIAAREKMEREYDIAVRVRALEDHYDAAIEERRRR